MKKSWILLILIISAVKRAIVARKLILACLLLIVILSGCVSNVYGPGWDYYRAGDTEKAVQYFQSRDAECAPCLCKIYSETGQYVLISGFILNALLIFLPFGNGKNQIKKKASEARF